MVVGCAGRKNGCSLFGVNKLTVRTHDTPNRAPHTPGHLSAPYTFGAVVGSQSLQGYSQPLRFNPMKTADVPYAADAELSLSFDELQVSLLLFLSPTIET